MIRSADKNKEVLNDNVNKEQASLKETYQELHSKLAEAKNANSTNSDIFEEKMHIVKDAYKEASSILQETKSVAFDIIDDNSSNAFFFIVGQGLLVESLGPFFVFVSTALKLYSYKPFRSIFAFWLSTFKW